MAKSKIYMMIDPVEGLPRVDWIVLHSMATLDVLWDLFCSRGVDASSPGLRRWIGKVGPGPNVSDKDRFPSTTIHIHSHVDGAETRYILQDARLYRLVTGADVNAGANKNGTIPMEGFQVDFFSVTIDGVKYDAFPYQIGGRGRRCAGGGMDGGKSCEGSMTRRSRLR